MSHYSGRLGTEGKTSSNNRPYTHFIVRSWQDGSVKAADCQDGVPRFNTSLHMVGERTKPCKSSSDLCAHVVACTYLDYLWYNCIQTFLVGGLLDHNHYDRVSTHPATHLGAFYSEILILHTLQNLTSILQMGQMVGKLHTKPPVLGITNWEP